MNKNILTAGLLTLASYCSGQTSHLSNQEVYSLFSPTVSSCQPPVETSIRDFFTSFMRQEHLYLPGYTPSEKVGGTISLVDAHIEPSRYRDELEFLTEEKEPLYILHVQDTILVNYKTEVIMKFLDGGDRAQGVSLYYTIRNTRSGHSLSEKILWQENVQQSESDKIAMDVFLEQSQWLYAKIKKEITVPLLTDGQ